jgi:hypothetical protein
MVDFWNQYNPLQINGHNQFVSGFEAAVTLTETELTFDRSYFHTATQIGIGFTEIESFIRQ